MSGLLQNWMPWVLNLKIDKKQPLAGYKIFLIDREWVRKKNLEGQSGHRNISSLKIFVAGLLIIFKQVWLAHKLHMKIDLLYSSRVGVEKLSCDVEWTVENAVFLRAPS